MANTATHDIWNGQSGRDWADNQRALDIFLRDAMDQLLADLPLTPGANVLDIGCGAGTLSLRMADQVAETGAVLGLDVSEPLLHLARRRSAGRDSLSFRKLDIQTDDLDQPGAKSSTRFDLCASQIGMMFFSDPVRALRRIRAHLCPGAVIAFNGWGQDDNPWFSLPLKVAERHLGPLPSAPASPAPISPPPVSAAPPPGPLAFADVTYVTGLLTKAGYDEVTGQRRTIAIRHPQGLAALMQSLSYVGPISTLYRLKQPDTAQRDAIAAEIQAEFTRYILPDGSLEMPGAMMYYKAIAP